MEINFPVNFRIPHKWVVIGILLISFLLRCILILRGGQYFNSDETRYEASREAARFLWQGQPREALQQLTILPEHFGFKVMGLIPALVEQIVGPSLVLPAIFYSLFSLFSLYLIFLLARRGQVSSHDREPLYALFLAAACLSLLYYSRHLFPYDMAMSLGLWALYVALARDQTPGMSFACGLLSFLCFITYNGYWPLAGFAILVNILMKNKTAGKILQTALATAAGFIAPLALLILGMRWLGTDLIGEYRLFSTTITQGSFQEGYSLPFAYFWHTEHAVILILGVFALIAMLHQFKDFRAYTMLWMSAFGFIYLCLVIPSVFLQYFVVYARLARQLIPFLVLLAAQGIVLLETRAVSGRRITALVFVVVFLQAAWNFNYFYKLHYPRDFAAEMMARFPEFEFSSKRLAFGAPVICQNNGYIIENAKFYATLPEEIRQVKGQLLVSVPHPANSLPYQYEGDPPEVRQVYSKLKLRMNFYKADKEFMSESNRMDIKNCLVPEE
jgi:hypothetical protein